MWTEQWSAKKQKPFFLDVVSGRRTWEHPVPTVAESYDSVAETQDDGVKPRALQEVRFFHNQVKGFALHMAMGGRHQLRALDVCCGKGGDLHKWMKSNQVAELCGFDVSPSCIEEAQKRASEQGWVARFRVHDGRKKEPWAQGAFDIISCQFAMHYFFSSSKLADHFFANCARLSTPTTKLVITYVDEERLRAHLWGGEEEYMPDFCTVSTRVSEPPSGQPFPYIFHLDGSVNQLAEYSVPQQVLIALLNRHKWAVEVNEPFVEFGRKHCMCLPSFEEGFAISRLYRVLIAARR